MIRLVVFFFLFFVLACDISEKDLRSQLDDFMALELKGIVAELREKKKDSLLSVKPYFKVHNTQIFTGDTAREYAAVSEVHFYYLRTLKLYQIRNYRYKTVSNFWERYKVQLRHIPEPIDAIEKIVAKSDSSKLTIDSARHYASDTVR